MPDDRWLYPLYETARELGIPILFHAGMSWEPGSRLQYGQPMQFENVAADFPDLPIVLAHLAWPWVTEAVALALKYPNLHLDTSALYFDNPRDFLRYAMTQHGAADGLRAQPAQADRVRLELPARGDQEHGRGRARARFF